jgi:hypothetical protein
VVTPAAEAGAAGAAGAERRSFVLLLWLEPGAGRGAPEWRWRVRWVQTGEEACFRRTADVLAFIAERAGLPPPD